RQHHELREEAVDAANVRVHPAAAVGPDSPAEAVAAVADVGVARRVQRELGAGDLAVGSLADQPPAVDLTSVRLKTQPARSVRGRGEDTARRAGVVRVAD